MKIKLFEEYNELDFSNFTRINWNEYNVKGLKFDDRELELIKNRKLHIAYINNNKMCIHVGHNFLYIKKIEDDYYVVCYDDYDNREKIDNYFKCDQLSELLKLIKYITDNES